MTSKYKFVYVLIEDGQARGVVSNPSDAITWAEQGKARTSAEFELDIMPYEPDQKHSYEVCTNSTGWLVTLQGRVLGEYTDWGTAFLVREALNKEFGK